VFSLLPNVRPYFTFLFSIPQEQTRLKYSPVAKILSRIFSRPLKKTHMPIALSIIEGCAQSPRVNSYGVCSCSCGFHGHDPDTITVYARVAFGSFSAAC